MAAKQKHITVKLLAEGAVISEKQMQISVVLTDKTLNGFAERLAYVTAVTGPAKAQHVAVHYGFKAVVCDIRMFREALEDGNAQDQH